MGRFLIALSIALVLASVCLEGQVFNVLAQGFAGLIHAGNEDANIENVHTDEKIQEVSKGENPRPSLLILADRWRNTLPLQRVLLIGNSQTFAVILAPGEQRPSAPPVTYPDLVGDRLKLGRDGMLYRLSAPNISYPEALWYTVYLSTVDAVRPGRLVLQLNYETFRKTGIRDGMLGLMAEPGFAVAIEKIIAENGPCSGVLEQAVQRYRDKEKVAVDTARPVGPSSSPGARWEAALRRRAETAELWGKKHEAKRDLLTLLYFMRVYFLKITPTTPRSLSGGAYETSVAALDQIAEICRTSRIELRLFLAPQNPAARLWRTSEDRNRYIEAGRKLGHKYGLQIVDLENAIPDRDWGVWVDGPDPIHFGVRAHRLMAEAVWKSGLVN